MTTTTWTQAAVAAALAGHRVVALETSVRAASVAVADEAGVRVTHLQAETAHASDLLPRVAELVAQAGWSPRDTTHVLVGLGPGSYTGLRVGVATALGLARGCDAALGGAPSIEALAAAQGEDGPVSVLLDARGGAAYHAEYERNGETWIEHVAPRAVPVAEAGAALRPDGPVLGDATIADRAGLDAMVRDRLTTDALPDARFVLERAALRLAAEGPIPAEQLQPLYLRAFGESV